MASLMLVRSVVGELQPKRTLAASRGFLAAARLSCYISALGRAYTAHSVKGKTTAVWRHTHNISHANSASKTLTPRARCATMHGAQRTTSLF